MKPENVRNAIISEASISIERGFALSSWIQCSDGHGSQGFGGWVLGGIGDNKVPSAQHSQQPNLAAEWITAVLKAAGVDSWSQVVGKSIRIARDGAGWNAKIIGISHIIDDDWFFPQERFDEMRREVA